MLDTLSISNHGMKALELVEMTAVSRSVSFFATHKGLRAQDDAIRDYALCVTSICTQEAAQTT